MTAHTVGRIFLAGPFKNVLDPATGLLAHADKARLVATIQLLEHKRFAVHCAHRREGWGANMMSPAECTKIDYDEIAAADVLVAFPGAPPSPGTHIELGWASAMQKTIVLLLERNKEYAFLVRGLGQVTSVVELCFGDDGELLRQLDAWSSAYADDRGRRRA